MPYFESDFPLPVSGNRDVPLAVMRERERDSVCEVCGGPLTTCWGGVFGHNEYMLRCLKDWQHQGIKRPYEPGAYDLPDQATMLNLTGGRKRHMLKELGQEKTTKLIQYAGASALTKEEATDILKTIWPEAPAIEVYKAALLCWQYRLNPLRKHVALMCFNKGKENESWATAIGIKADRLIAHRPGAYSYIDNTPRAMTEQEQKTILGEVDTANLWTITKVKDGKGNEAQGYGSWPKTKLVWRGNVQVEVDNQPYGSDKGNNKFNMSCIRGERQALDRLRPGEMPENVEVMDERYMDTPAGKVEVATGEILGGGAKPLTEIHFAGIKVIDQENPPVDEASQLGDEEFDGLQSPSSKPKVKLKRDPITIKSLTELYRACNEDFHLQPKGVLKELGVSSANDIIETPADCYRKVAAVRVGAEAAS